MIKKEFFRIREDGVVLYRTYSDANLYISKVGTEEVYSEAIDVSNATYTYEETSKAIEEEVNSTDKNEDIIENSEYTESVEEI